MSTHTHNKLRRFRKHSGIAARRLAVIGAILTIGVMMLAPALVPKTEAAATITDKETVINLPTSDGAHVYSCQAKFMTGGSETLDLLNKAFNSYGKVPINSQADIANKLGPSTGGGLPGPLNQSQVDYLTNNYNKPIVYVTFVNANQNGVNGGTPINGGFSAGGSACGQFYMIQVGTAEWYMVIGTAPVTNNSSSFIDFTMDNGQANNTDVAGTMSYSLQNTGLCEPNAIAGVGCAFINGSNPASGSHAFTIAGPVVASAPPPGVDLGTVSISWLNASQFSLVTSSKHPAYDGEVYQKLNWGGTQEGLSYYFLTNLGQGEQSATGRMTTSNNSYLCSDPLPGWSGDHNVLPNVSCNSSAGVECVPFFAISQPSPNLDVLNQGSDPGLSGLQANINDLATSAITYYDFTPSGSSCVYGGKTSNIAEYNNLPGAGSASVWLYYSAKDDEFATVFTGGSDNETNWIGTYTKAATDVYNGPSGGCAGQITVTGLLPTTANTIFPNRVSWQLGEGDCGQVSVWGTLRVNAMTVDENTFQAVQQAINTNNSQGNNAPKLACDFLSFNPLNWLFCPIIDAAEGIVQGLDNLINNLLVLDTSTSQVSVGVFSSSSSNGYHEAWGAFRAFALGLIAIAALIMIISQAAGIEAFDAYTIRKLLPRLLISAIGITLSWSILQFFGQLSNDLGIGVRQLIYAPFSGVQGQLSGGSSLVGVLLGTGAAIAFGWLALLSFVATGLLAVLVGVGVLIFRQLLWTLVVITAPIGIGFYALPQTQKGWKIWYDSALAVVISFPIISFMIAAGRVLAATSLAQNANGATQTIYQIIAIVAYFAPYFLIPLAFRMAGGFLETIGGFANDRSRGAFDRLKKFRAGQVKKNMTKIAEGNRFRENENSHIRSAFNNFTAGAAAFGMSDDKRRFLTDRGARQSAIAMHRETNAHHFADSAQGKFLQYQDRANQALTFENEEQARAQMAAEYGASQHEVEEAINAVRSAGGWSQARRVTAVQRLYQSGTGFRNIREATRAVTRVAGDNEDIANSLIGSGRSASRAAGRTDMASSSFGTQRSLYLSQRASGLNNAAGSAEENAMAHRYRAANVEALLSDDAVTHLRGKNGSLQNMLQAAGETAQEIHGAAANGDQDARALQGQLAAAVDGINGFRYYASPQNATTAFNNAEGPQLIDTLERTRAIVGQDAGVPTSAVDPATGQRLELLTPESRAHRAVGTVPPQPPGGPGAPNSPFGT